MKTVEVREEYAVRQLIAGKESKKAPARRKLPVLMYRRFKPV